MERNPRLGEYWLLGCHPTSLESGERVANSAPNMATTEQAASRRWISPQLGRTESRGQRGSGQNVWRTAHRPLRSASTSNPCTSMNCPYGAAPDSWQAECLLGDGKQVRVNFCTTTESGYCGPSALIQNMPSMKVDWAAKSDRQTPCV